MKRKDLLPYPPLVAYRAGAPGESVTFGPRQVEQPAWRSLSEHHQNALRFPWEKAVGAATAAEPIALGQRVLFAPTGEAYPAD